MHGIVPGSGVKNNRNKINNETLGVPVIAIGIPTVVSISSIINEATSKIFSEEEKNRFLNTIYTDKNFDFMVTPNIIDDAVNNLSELISEGINKALLETN